MKIQPAANGISQASRKLVLLCLSSSLITLMGCQSTPSQHAVVATNSTISQNPLIYSADYQKSIQSNYENYQQQFATNSGINNDEVAKTALLQAIKQHLATPHVAVSKTRVNDAAFIKKGSVDEHSASAYKTLFEMIMDYAASKDQLSDYDYDDEYYEDENEYDYDEDEVSISEDYDEEDNSDLAAVMKEVEDARAAIEEYEENGENEAYYESESEEYDEYDEYDDYEEYEEDQDDSQEYKSIIDTIYKWYNRSPEQIEATNYYYNKNLTLNKISEYDPKNKKVSMVYSYDFVSPTTLYSIKLPLALDFNRSELTFDPSAILPLVAIVTPEHAPLPEELEAPIVAFKLPEEIKDKMPPTVIYDAFISAISYGLSELDSGNFTSVDISKDSYAKSVGAHSAVKLNLDSKQSGKVLGTIIKHMSQTLQDYVDLHPDLYSDSDAITVVLDKWQQLNTKYQSSDVGSLFQLIEAVAPLTFHQSNYYYLDARGKLLAVQSSSSVGGDFMGATTTALSQTTYDTNSFNVHPLNEVYQQSFGKPFSNKVTPSVDGNAWLDKIKDRRDKLQQAYLARSEYDSDDALYGNKVDESIDDEGEYHPSIKVIDYGNVNDYPSDDKDGQNNKP